MKREDLIRLARIYLQESRTRKGISVQRSFTFSLLQWAGDCRRAAAGMKDEPAQLDLFGGW